MFSIVGKVVRAFSTAFTRPRQLAVRNLALEHQLDVVLRPARPRLRPRLCDRILWVWLSRTWLHRAGLRRRRMSSSHATPNPPRGAVPNTIMMRVMTRRLSFW